MGNVLCGFGSHEVCVCSECGCTEQPSRRCGEGPRGEWRKNGSQLLCSDCADLRHARRRGEREMMLAFKPAVKETPLRRINSGTEWCSTPSFKGSYHATMSEGVAQKVSLAQRRQDFDAAHAWLSSPLPGTDEAAAAEHAALEASSAAFPPEVAADCAPATGAAHDGVPSLAGVHVVFDKAARGEEGGGCHQEPRHEPGCSEWSAEAAAAEGGRKGVTDRDSARSTGGRRPQAEAWTCGCANPMETVYVSTSLQRPSIHALLSAGPEDLQGSGAYR